MASPKLPKRIMNAFNSGEISPLVMGRMDVEKYYSALLSCENWWPMIEGGIQVRPGTILGGVAKNVASHGLVRFLEFKFSASDQLILEIGHNYIRFWNFDPTTGLPTQVKSGGNPVEVTTTYADSDLAYLQVRQVGNLMYFAGGNPPQVPQVLSRFSNTSWNLGSVLFNPAPTFESGFTPPTTLYASAASGTGITFTAGANAFLAGDVGREIVSNVSTAIATIKGFTNATTVTGDIVQGTFPLVGAPFNSGDWFINDSPVSTLKLTPTSYPAPGDTGVIIAYTNSSFSVNRDTFRSTDVGSYIYILGGLLQITAYTSASQISYIDLINCSQFTTTNNFANGGLWTLETPAWSAGNGYPSVIGLHQQRLFYGNWTKNGNSFRASRTGLFLNFATGTTADASLDFTLVSDTVVPIQWFASDLNLIAGTLTREFYVGDVNGAPLTPTSPSLTPQASMGCCGIAPLLLENALLFISRGQRQVGELLFNVVTNRAESVNLLEYASHLTRDVSTPADRILTGNACQIQPVPFGWYIRADGTLCGLLYRRKQNVSAWFRTTTWRGAVQDVIESVAVLQNPVSQMDQAWVSVNRGGTRYIEVFDVFPNSYYKMDASYRYSGAATATISVPQPNGWTVGIRGKDAGGTWRLYPDQAVAGGQITGLSPTVVEAEIGLRFTATATTPPAEFRGAETIQGRPLSYGFMTVRSYSTSMLTIQGVRYPPFPAYSSSSVYVVPTSGLVPTGSLSPAGAWADFELSSIGVDRFAEVTFVQDLPLGGTVLMFCADLSIGA